LVRDMLAIVTSFAGRLCGHALSEDETATGRGED
jgi:predicted site-specific integrase-resolvase